MADDTKKKRILLVDASPTTRQQVGSVLANHGFDVLGAEDGVDGINQLQSAGEINMIISDVNMPNMGGLEMLGAIRKIEQFKFLPILMLTTEGGGDMVERAKKSGASGCLAKPVNPDRLIGIVKELAR
ncbi:response regulator [Streptomyces sp. NPDC056492]|uniref:response regulator n=1 Tax=unclassified Streptomyces TaxID=2593676 RepID=UPI003686DD6E